MSATSEIEPAAAAHGKSIPFFRPWKGENYESGVNGKRLLLLGESHYGSGVVLRR